MPFKPHYRLFKARTPFGTHKPTHQTTKVAKKYLKSKSSYNTIKNKTEVMKMKKKLFVGRKVKIPISLTTDPFNMRGEDVKIVGWDADREFVKVKSKYGQRRYGIYDRDIFD